jgi:hypothetical protein
MRQVIFSQKFAIAFKNELSFKSEQDTFWLDRSHPGQRLRILYLTISRR